MARQDTFAEARLKLRDLFGHAYRTSVQHSRYRRDEGILVIPVMGPAGTAPAKFRVHAPIGYREFEFEYAKDNTPPLYPAQADTGTGDTFLGADIVFPTPRINDGGWLTFGVRGTYTYVQPEGGRSTEDSYPIDRYPFVTQLDALHTLPAPAGDGLQDAAWTWNSQDIAASLTQSYDIVA
jgi:hypothetical protein